MGVAQVTINGRSVPISGVPTHATVLDFLREQDLTGCKEGCAEGECGACSVLVARPGIASPTEWVALNACLVPIAAFGGQEIVTSEGLAGAEGLHPVQQEMVVRGGSQCGYCTPGFICSMAAEYYRSDRRGAANDGHAADFEHGHAADFEHGHAADFEHGPNGFDLEALSGNLCRCGCYRPIRDAAYALGTPARDDPLRLRCARPAPSAAAFRLTGPDGEFVCPADLPEVLQLLADRPDAKLVAGATDWGVDVNIKGVRAPLLVAIDRLPELRGFEIADDRIEIGAVLTLSEIEDRLDGRVPLLDQMFPQFASRQIRNGATLGGNLATASPIGDTPPALLALDAVLLLASAQGEREVALADYFTGYRQTVRQPAELIKSIRIPLPLGQITAFHKIAKRRFDDISSVAAGYAIDVTDGLVGRARIGVGGVAATPVRATETEAALLGRPWTEATVAAAGEVMGREGTPIDDQRASARYRAAMLRQSLLKLYAGSTSPEEVGA